MGCIHEVLEVPILKSLAVSGSDKGIPEVAEQLELAPAPDDEDEGDENISLSGGPESLLPGPDESYEAQLNAIKRMVADDPRLVAQVVKQWITADG